MIETAQHNDVLEIVLTNPPVNALAGGVRTALLGTRRAAIGHVA